MYRRSKYNAVKTAVDGVIFDSKAEAERWVQLQLLERAGVIRKLCRQIDFDLFVNDFLICKYISDFVYERKEGRKWQLVVEDVKGVKTRDYQLKKKLMFALHDIQIEEITKKKSR